MNLPRASRIAIRKTSIASVRIQTTVACIKIHQVTVVWPVIFNPSSQELKVSGTKNPTPTLTLARHVLGSMIHQNYQGTELKLISSLKKSHPGRCHTPLLGCFLGHHQSLSQHQQCQEMKRNRGVHSFATSMCVGSS